MKKVLFTIFSLVLFVGMTSISKADKLVLDKVIGTGNYGDKMATIDDSEFRHPYGLNFNRDGNLVVVDSYNNILKEIFPNGKIRTFAGRLAEYDLYDVPFGGFRDGNNTQAQFNKPRNMCRDSGGNFYLADTENNVIRRVSKNITSLVAGNGEKGYEDGVREKVMFNRPSAVARDDDKNLYVADTGNNVIRKISTKGEVTTYAGVHQEKGGYKDGNLDEALFNEPSFITYYKGALYVVDSGNHAIRIIKDDKVDTFVGIVKYPPVNKEYAVSGDISTMSKFSKLNFPKSICFMENNDMLIADTWNKKIKVLDGEKLRVEELETYRKGNDEEIKFEMNTPVNVISKGQKVYVSDLYNNCIYEFNYVKEEVKHNFLFGNDYVVINIDEKAYEDIFSLAYIKNGRIMFPLRFILENWEAKVIWNNEEKMIYVIKDNKQVKINPYSEYSEIIDGRTMIDPKYLKENYGVIVGYDKYVRLYIDGEEIYLKGNLPYKDNGKFMLPLREILESWGAKVEWINSTKKIKATKNNESFEISGVSKYTRIINGRTMIDMDYLKRLLDLDIAYDEEENVMYLYN